MMEIVENIQLYLPQYLSSEDKSRLKEELAKFPTDGTKDTIYTNALNGADYLLQGDGIGHVPYLDFPNLSVKNIPVMLMSNTCDMATSNARMNSCRIMYSPIINLEKYENMLKSKFSIERVKSHINDIRRQYISQILYLPKGGLLDYEGIVFFDRTISIPLTDERVEEMCKNKLFTLSNYGFYLYLLKISIHFTRIQEKINRATGKDLSENFDL